MTSVILHNDPELLHRVADGDEKAFEQLAMRYSEKIFFHALTFVKSYPLAEEIVQDIFLKIWENRSRLKEVKNFDNYLFILSKNHLISRLRKRLLETEAVDAEGLEELVWQPDKQYETRELQQLLEKGLLLLPEQKRNVFRLIHQEGLTQEETGRRLGMAARTVRWNLVAATQFLKEFLHQHLNDAGLYLLLLQLTCFVSEKKL